RHAGHHAQGRGRGLGPHHLQGPDPARDLRTQDVRDLVQDDATGAWRLPAGQGADPPVADRRVPAGLRPDGSRQGRKGGAVVDVTGNSATARYQATLDEIREAGLFKAERIITSPQAAEIVLEDGRKV